MKELTFIYMRWTIQDARTGALLQLQSIPSQHLSSPPFAACAHSIWFPFLLAVRLLPPTMSSQQCLRHLPSPLRSSALRAGARSAVRAPWRSICIWNLRGREDPIPSSQQYNVGVNLLYNVGINLLGSMYRY